MSDKMNELMAQLSQKLNMSPEKVLSDPEKQRQILNSPQAQAIMKLLNKK